LNDDGSVDPSFLPGFVVSASTDSNHAESILRQHDGRLVLAGQFVIPNHRVTSVVRLSESGEPDPGFAQSGLEIVPGYWDHMLIDPDDRLLLGRGTLRRLLASGGPDPDFMDERGTASLSELACIEFFGQNRLVACTSSQILSIRLVAATALDTRPSILSQVNSFNYAFEGTSY
jgi:hypothetical protein